MNNERRKIKLTDRPLFGAFLLIFNNLLAVVIVFVINDFALITANLSSTAFFTGLIGFALLVLLMNVMFLMTYISKRKLIKRCFISLNIFFLLVASFGVGYFYLVQGKFDNSLVDAENTTAYILVKSDIDTNDTRIGVVAPKESTLTIIREKLENDLYDEQIVTFTNYSTMIDELISGTLEYALLPSNYRENLTSQTGLLSKLEDVKTYEISTANSTNITKEPFSMILYGTNEDLPDSIMLITVNPSTLKVTMTSIPRDSYVPISCLGYQLDKLNHSASVGNLDCTTETIENMLGITIDYYASINFDGVIDLVDAMGGLELTVDRGIAGEYYSEGKEEPTQVFVPQGTHLLTGEQVLTFVRERHSYVDGDFQRQKNQQYVLQEIAKKMLTLESATRITGIMDAVGKHFKTNMSQSDILSLVNFGLEQMNTYTLDGVGAFRIETSRITGIGDGPYAYSPAMGMELSVVYVYHQSLEDNKVIIQGNLLQIPEKNESTSITFTQEEPYVPVRYQSFYDSYKEWE